MTDARASKNSADIIIHVCDNLEQLHGKNNFAEISRNLDRYKSNFVGSSNNYE